MARSTPPPIEGVSGETPDGTVWAEVKATVKTADYESVGLTLGQSLRVEGSKANRRQARRQLLRECEQEVADKVSEIRESWSERT